MFEAKKKALQAIKMLSDRTDPPEVALFNKAKTAYEHSVKSHKPVPALAISDKV